MPTCVTMNGGGGVVNNMAAALGQQPNQQQQQQQQQQQSYHSSQQQQQQQQQPAWKALSDFALQSEIEKPPFQQLVRAWRPLYFVLASVCFQQVFKYWIKYAPGEF